MFHIDGERGDDNMNINQQYVKSQMYHIVKDVAIVRFTLNSSTRIIEFRGFLSQFSTNFHEISHTLFSIHVVTFDEYFDEYCRS